MNVQYALKINLHSDKVFNVPIIIINKNRTVRDGVRVMFLCVVGTPQQLFYSIEAKKKCVNSPVIIKLF